MNTSIYHVSVCGRYLRGVDTAVVDSRYIYIYILSFFMMNASILDDKHTKHVKKDKTKISVLASCRDKPNH